jgi:hypothetical protein
MFGLWHALDTYKNHKEAWKAMVKRAMEKVSPPPPLSPTTRPTPTPNLQITSPTPHTQR